LRHIDIELSVQMTSSASHIRVQIVVQLFSIGLNATSFSLHWFSRFVSRIEVAVDCKLPFDASLSLIWAHLLSNSSLRLKPTSHSIGSGFKCLSSDHRFIWIASHSFTTNDVLLIVCVCVGVSSALRSTRVCLQIKAKIGAIYRFSSAVRLHLISIELGSNRRIIEAFNSKSLFDGSLVLNVWCPLVVIGSKCGQNRWSVGHLESESTVLLRALSQRLSVRLAYYVCHHSVVSVLLSQLLKSLI